ncbi:MAG: hypothetical protein KDH19_14890, partial [Geminicoccaceae bacterium]|nr:hypothetical protein [Geminicoccaceae bacterium]
MVRFEDALDPQIGVEENSGRLEPPCQKRNETGDERAGLVHARCLPRRRNEHQPHAIAEKG